MWNHVPGKAIDDLETPTIRSALEELGKLGESAQASMTKAEKAIALAEVEEGMVSIGSAGPELFVSIFLQNIEKRHLLEEVKMNVNQLYQEYTSKLVSVARPTKNYQTRYLHYPCAWFWSLTTLKQYQINQFPRKRLLRTIQKLQEELTVVQLVNSWQRKTFTSLLQVLDPQTFEDPIPDRINMYPSESECISDSLKSLQTKAVELEALEHRTQYLREQLKQSVEILEEDHGKAILVFTMITTIFLPLLVSFIVAY
jgi:Mg2+ and Co2+ transporter CorA